MIPQENLVAVEEEEYNRLIFLLQAVYFCFKYVYKVGPAGFEPTTSSAQGWHPTMLDNDPSFILKFSSNFNLILIDVESKVYPALLLYYLRL